MFLFPEKHSRDRPVSVKYSLHDTFPHQQRCTMLFCCTCMMQHRESARSCEEAAMGYGANRQAYQHTTGGTLGS